MTGSLKFAYEAQSQITPNQITLNQIMWRQTKTSIAKLSFVHKREKRA